MSGYINEPSGDLQIALFWGGGGESSRFFSALITAPIKS